MRKAKSVNGQINVLGVDKTDASRKVIQKQDSIYTSCFCFYTCMSRRVHALVSSSYAQCSRRDQTPRAATSLKMGCLPGKFR